MTTAILCCLTGSCARSDRVAAVNSKPRRATSFDGLGDTGEFEQKPVADGLMVLYNAVAVLLDLWIAMPDPDRFHVTSVPSPICNHQPRTARHNGARDRGEAARQTLDAFLRRGAHPPRGS